MTRKQLEDLGISKEQADSIMKINGDDIENAKSASAAEIKNLQTEVTGLKTQVSDRDKQLETLKTAAGDNETLTKQIADLQAENTKVKDIKAVKALLELEDAKLDKDGNVRGLAEQIEKLTSGDDTKFLFEAQKQTKQQQNFKGFQPGASGEQKPGEGEKVDFSKMSYDELTAYMEANLDAQI